MNDKILAKAVQDYIHLNLNADVAQIALAKSPFVSVSSAELAAQILAKKKSQKKLPTWFNTSNIYYPPPLSIEQTSSETTAKYKSRIAKGNSLIDLTGGFGVDAYYFAKKVEQVVHCEINVELSEISKHNTEVLQTDNIDFLPLDGIKYIESGSKNFDTIYIDPARRAETGKVFMLGDCTPDVVSHLDKLLSKSTRIIIKTAPLLDITAGLLELKYVSEIHIVSLKNECKELLWVIDKDFNGTVKIVAVTLNETEKHFSFLQSELNDQVHFAAQISKSNYLYEPDAALLKSGAFNLIGEKYNLQKLHPHTQLYISDELNKDFVGRIFRVDQVLSTRELKKNTELSGNIIVRNYPAKPEDLAKKYKVKPDKDHFLIFTKDISGNNIVLKTIIVQYY